MITPVPPYTIDLEPFLPSDWDVDLRKASVDARPVRREGGGPGSLSVDNAGLDYRVLQRSELLDLVPWLRTIHEETLPALLNLVLDEPVIPITSAHGLNLNVLLPDSSLSGLEWHLDGADVERVVILSTEEWNSETGGRLLYHDGYRTQSAGLIPGRGLSVGTGDTPHAVEQPDKERITVMFAYTNERRQGEREKATDRYLYPEA